MQLDVGMLVEESCDQLGLVRREVVQNDVDLPVRFATGDDLAEKVDEFSAGVARGGFALDRAGLGVQRRVQRQRAVALVLEAVPFGAAGGQRQHAVAAVKSLNRRLFVDREDRGVARRIQVQADDLGGFALEVGIVRSHVALEPMRLETGFLPNLVNHCFADAELGGEFAARPMSRTVARLASGRGENLGA